MPQGTFDVTLDPLASPLRRPRVARALTWTLGILLAFAALLICTVVARTGFRRDRRVRARAGPVVRDVAAADPDPLVPRPP